MVGYTQADIDLWTDLMARCMACAGAAGRHRAQRLRLRPVHRRARRALRRRAARLHRRAGVRRHDRAAGHAAAGLRRPRPLRDAVLCAQHRRGRRRHGRRSSQVAFKDRCFGAEPWSDALRRELDERLGIRSVDLYGLSEIIGPGVACECGVARDGLHGWEDHFLFEVIDPKTLEPVPAGEPGELVITTLTKEALPMVRYRSRDITRLNHEPCACGRTHVRIMRVTGRDDDMMIIRGVNVYPSQVEAVLVGCAGVAPHYQIVLTREGALDTMTVEVETAPGAPADDAHRQKTAKDIVGQIKARLGVSCEVVIKASGEVPRSQGKAVRVKDLRKKHDAPRPRHRDDCALTTSARI